MCYIMKNKLFMFLTLLFTVFTFKTNAFGSTTHFTITHSAYLRTGIFDKFDAKESKALEAALVQGCNIPDKEESFYIYKAHFFNVMPKTINRFEDSLITDDNAENRMYQHFENSIEFYKGGDKIGAFDELGRSLHFLEDMCCPVHLLGWLSLKHNGLTIRKSKGLHITRIHDLYEDVMDEESGKFFFKLMESDKPFDFKKIYGLKGLSGYPLKAYYDYKSLHQTEPTYEAFKNAHEASCDLIYLFSKEVGIEL